MYLPRIVTMSACVFLFSVGYPVSAQTASLTLSDYFQHVGRESFFSGRLLTADDFSDEQQYVQSRQRFLPDLNFSLQEIFASAGTTSVTLMFDIEDVFSGMPNDPTDANRPQADDFVLLDNAQGTWRGQVYLPEFNGVYELEGTFVNLVPEPNPILLSSACSAVLLLYRFHFRRTITTRHRRIK